MIILGINAYHPDSSACILVDGKIKLAIEEERINRIKHWSGFPVLSIKECLFKENISIKDVDFIAINQDLFSNFFHRISYLISKKPNFDFLINNFLNKKKRLNILNIIEKEIGTPNKKCKLINVEHHRCHVASAFFDSNYEKSVNLSVDGFGDFASLTWGISEKNYIKIYDKILFPHSLGIFYEAFTQFLGFHNYGDEYKVMGLSSLGKPTELKKLENIISLKKKGKFLLNLDYFNHHKKKISYSWNDSSPKQESLFDLNKITELFGNPREQDSEINEVHRNIAASVQACYENTLFYILNYIYEKFRIDKLTLSGGCAQNSLANGKIINNTSFKSLFVPANPGDAGGAVGAAYSAWHQITKSRPTKNKTAYLGGSYSNNYIEEVILSNKLKLDLEHCKFFYISDEDYLCKFIAEEISKKKVIGWFQGRMEWGPRALGNRSIISDPRNPDIKDLLNIKIKRRESFRPFAPSILLEEAADWFEDFNDEELYMSRVLKFKKDKTKLVPGVVHIDGTGRLQTVKQEHNKRYYNLIKNFKFITGIPILLNTSFNENEPIVLKPEQALDCFLRTKMDILVMENWVVTR
jgi:carbamoyltransferase